jgi:hypothetical protein
MRNLNFLKIGENNFLLFALSESSLTLFNLNF